MFGPPHFLNPSDAPGSLCRGSIIGSSFAGAQQEIPTHLRISHPSFVCVIFRLISTADIYTTYNKLYKYLLLKLVYMSLNENNILLNI